MFIRVLIENAYLLVEVSFELRWLLDKVDRGICQICVMLENMSKECSFSDYVIQLAYILPRPNESCNCSGLETMLSAQYKKQVSHLDSIFSIHISRCSHVFWCINFILYSSGLRIPYHYHCHHEKNLLFSVCAQCTRDVIGYSDQIDYFVYSIFQFPLCILHSARSHILLIQSMSSVQIAHNIWLVFLYFTELIGNWVENDVCNGTETLKEKIKNKKTLNSNEWSAFEITHPISVNVNMNIG